MQEPPTAMWAALLFLALRVLLYIIIILLSAKKFSLYPEGVTQPSQGQRPWYTIAVLTAAPAGHNSKNL